MLLMSKGLEDRISEPTEVVENATLIYETEKFPCNLVRIEVDFEENKKILRVKVPIQVMDYIYNGRLPTGLDYSGNQLRLDEDLVRRAACEKTDTLKGPKAVLTLEVGI